ncbi:MAG: sulfatase-like hydrolase/transferase, partial [Planctomycetota bacterium]
MQHACLAALLFCLVSCVGPGADARAAPRPPNIVFVMADDMGYGDVHALNRASAIPTPNLDRLAAAGCAFTDAHTPSSVCTPTRYGVLTGRYCWRGRLKRGVINGY